MLVEASWKVEEASGGADALARLDSGRYAALLVDNWLADLDVPELVRIARHRFPKVDVLTFDPDASGAEAPSPGSHTRGLARLVADLNLPSSEGTPGDKSGTISGEAAFADDSPLAEAPLPGMVGQTAPMRTVYRMARLVAPRKTAVLITGESGTGKELVARALHDLSDRAEQPFVVVNCAAIPETMLEAELFGYVRGAFTGAVQARLGLAQAAHGGTLFLDEVGELPPGLQAKLLRFLQQGEVQRLGSNDVFQADVRVIAATNADLEARVGKGTFRRDLYYRLAVFPLRLPGLRQRTGDIELLAQTALQRLSGDARVCCRRLSPQALVLLRGYDWPGNVRELEHLLERAFILAGDRADILPEDFPDLAVVQ